MLPTGKSTHLERKKKPRSNQKRSHTGPAKHALIIFAKAPIPGEVKTRLCPPLVGDEAASLYGSMVMDTLERCTSLHGFDRYLACTPNVDHAFFKTMAARYKVHLWEQIGTTLGERMNQALTTALDKGYQHALLIGTDLPTFSAQSCPVAINTLKNHDVVFGPTSDGGYYLVGMKHPAPELFRDIPWSTPSVLSVSLDIAQGLGLSVGQLNLQHDIDTIEDLKILVSELKGPGKKNFSNRTANVLLAIAQRHLAEQ